MTVKRPRLRAVPVGGRGGPLRGSGSPCCRDPQKQHAFCPRTTKIWEIPHLSWGDHRAEGECASCQVPVWSSFCASTQGGQALAVGWERSVPLACQEWWGQGWRAGLHNDLGETGQNAKPLVSGISDAVFSLWQLAWLLSPAALPTIN